MNTLKTFCMHTLLVLLLITVTGLAQEQSKPVEIGQIFTMHSEILQEERTYWVSLPDGYNDSTYTPRSYPVLYVLDGSRFFHPVTGMVKYMNLNPQIPEMIIVAIPNTNRIRDLFPTHSMMDHAGQKSEHLEETGGGEAFLEFVREELFTIIEQDYRTLPYRIIVGHSAGGLLALYSLFEYPDMFQAYLAFDPAFWWDDELLLRQLQKNATHIESRNDAVYISLANKSGIVQVYDTSSAQISQQRFLKRFQTVSAPQLRRKTQYFESENHLTVPLRSVYHGLLFVFEGYEPSDELVYNRPSALVDHFEQVSRELNVELRPSEPILDEIGYAILHSMESPDKAMEVFKAMVHFYPQSAPAYAGMGEVYLAKGDTVSAIDAFLRTLMYDPRNNRAREVLQSVQIQN